MIVWASLDESADRKQAEAYVVASLVATGDDWFEFERQWSRSLKQNGIVYFKTHEFRKLKGQFAQFSGNQARAQEIWNELAQIIRVAPMAGLVLGLNLRDYHKVRVKLKADKTLAPNPYKTAYQIAFVRMAAFMKEIEAPAPLAYLCDEHSQAKYLVASHPSLRKLNPNTANYIGSLNFGIDEKLPALQASDLIAGVCKDYFIDHTNGNTTEQDRDVLRKKIGDAVALGYIAEGMLEKLVRANVLKNGRPSVYSSLQQKLFLDLLDVKKPKSMRVKK